MLRRQWWDDRIMAWAMDDAMLKVQLFRFVDVLPMLSTDAAVAEHLHEYLSEVELPGPIRTALRVARRSKLGRAALARMARLGARDHARRFIAGSNVDEVVAAARRERELGRGFTLDILGEAVTSETVIRPHREEWTPLCGCNMPL
jgi:RHH-type proline utilization regulon transcriptional repressor/proline dehydrogenase/delta 1-pyrroline-5-carboxylate dehydrogenase